MWINLRTKLEDSFQLDREHLKSSAERQMRLYDRKVSGKGWGSGMVVGKG